MKILFVLEYYFPHIGGVETVFQELGERLVKLGHDISIVTINLPNTHEFEIINGVKIHRVNVPKIGSRYWFDFFVSIPKILDIAKDVDIIHSSDYITAFPVFCVAKLRKKPCIMTVTEPIGGMFYSVLGLNYVKAKMLMIMERMLLSLPFDKYACISYYTRNCLRFMGLSDKKITTIYLGIDEETFSRNSISKINVRNKLNLQKNFVYLSFGRPGITKGIEYLIMAVPHILEKIPHSMLVLILSKDPINRYEMLKKMISDGKYNNIILIDPVPRAELPDYISSADCVVVPSLTEGFGFTAAEACAMGKPVVATNIGSLPEVVYGKSILIEPRNPEAIAQAVIKISKNEVNISPKKDFSWNTCVEKYLKSYNEILL